MKSLIVSHLFFSKGSHPVRGAWIEIIVSVIEGIWNGSHPVRGAWIEIKRCYFRFSKQGVASRKGCVD